MPRYDVDIVHKMTVKNFDIQPDKLQYIFVGIVHKMIDIGIDI